MPEIDPNKNCNRPGLRLTQNKKADKMETFPSYPLKSEAPSVQFSNHFLMDLKHLANLTKIA